MPSFEIKTRARANSKRASNENTEPKADHEDVSGSVQVTEGSKKSIKSTRAAKAAEKQSKVLQTLEDKSNCGEKTQTFDERVGN